MARFVQDLTLNKPDNFVYFIMNDYLQKQKFVMSDWKGEAAYRTGDGFIEGYKFLKWSYVNGQFHLEAWMKGSFGGEWNLDGFVGCLMKKPYKESLMQLFQVLQQPLPENTDNIPVAEAGSGQENAAEQGAGTVQGEGAGAVQSSGTQTGTTPRVIPVQTVDQYKAAQAGLVFGILSIVLGVFIPLLGILFGGIGISRARTGAGSSKDSQARAGKICSIVGICVSAGIWVLNFLLSTLLMFL